jgi:methanogenic corrinoid protein MtbC1
LATLPECCDQLKDSVLNFNRDQVAQAAAEVVSRGYDVHRAVFDGLLAGMLLVGERYEADYWLPEVLLCTEALNDGLAILRPHLSQPDWGIEGEVVLGVAQDDETYANAAQFECTNCSLVPNFELDAAKGVVKGLFDAAGFRVHDLGRNVPLSELVRALETDSDVICLLALVTGTPGGLNQAIRQIKEKNPRGQILIGGRLVTAQAGGEWGIDGYSFNGGNALREALGLLTALQHLSTVAKRTGGNPPLG